MAVTLSTFDMKLGDIAPNFSLPDGFGELHHLNDLAGEKGTLIIFACNHCPFVIHLVEALADFSKEAAAQGITTIAINSNDAENYPQDGPQEMVKFAADSDWQFPYLFDESQEVAKAYRAACTPDFYLFDADKKLTYAGQFDDSRPKNGSVPDGNDIRAALSALLNGESLSEQKPSSGCNIKWIPGNEPNYFG